MIKVFKLREERGFSLVELMIVVAIIAILAAIAIPAFMRFAIKSKTAEATGNLSAIRTCEEAYRAENDVYIIAVLPTPLGGGTDSTPDVWTGAASLADFNQMGFEPDGNVRYTYAVNVSPNGGAAAPSGVTNECIGAFEITASSDLDEDGTPGTFIVDSGGAGYPKPNWNGQY